MDTYSGSESGLLFADRFGIVDELILIYIHIH